MYIKSLKIQGFKSYRDETIVDPFSSGLNLLVGRNGSGKSNFFSAIRFVLSDAYTSLTREERQALLHDGSTTGSGAGTMSAYVEIEFDNSDGRFPTGNKTLILRRTIGLKKDEYQLDRKSTSKGEVMSVLESAGFSRSNPYYIVPQGRVTHLTNQKDLERLALLKEVAGTKVYEDRRGESMKIIEDTNAKKAKIGDSLEYIKERLDQLEQEKEDLKQYHVLDRARRSLQYAIYQQELSEVSRSLDDIEEERRSDLEGANVQRVAAMERNKELDQIRSDISDAKQAIQSLKLEHEQLQSDRRDSTKSQARVEEDILDFEEASKRGSSRVGKLQAELEKVEEEISEKETRLMEVTPAWEDKKTANAQAQEELERVQTSLRVLEAKQGRASQFRTQSERDTYLKSQIVDRRNLISQHSSRAQEVNFQVARAQADLEDVQKRVFEARKSLETTKASMVSITKEAAQLREKQTELTEQRKDAWKQDSMTENKVQHALTHLKEAERQLGSTMDRGTRDGIRAAGNIADRLGLSGYYGPLYELFKCEDRYRVATEVTAGNSLFHIVVDTDDTATKILDVMVKERLGRVTFIPLNRVKTQNIEYPSSNDAIALIKKLTFDDMYEAAFQQVFGRTIVCQSLSVAGGYTRSHGLTAITLDGDRYDRKGSISGGFYDTRRSRLDAIRALSQWQERYEQEKAASDGVKHLISKLDQEGAQVAGKLRQLERQLQHIDAERDQYINAASSGQREEESLRTRLARLEKARTDSDLAVRGLEAEVEAYESEMKSKMTQSLSSAELKELDNLNGELDETRKALRQYASELADLESEKSVIEIELSDSLRRRRDELSAKIDSSAGGAGSSSRAADIDLASRKKEIKVLKQRIEHISTRLGEVDEQMQQLSSKLQSLQKDQDKKEAAQAEDNRAVSRQQKNVERYLARLQTLNSRKDEINVNIRDLGVLPEEAFQENNTSLDKLAKKLRKVNEKLKEFAHVNKKAYEQFTSFTKQQEELQQRHDELERSHESIEELINALDLRKDEAISRTFKQVSKYFEEIFAKLVPAGRGRLIMLKRDADSEDESDVEMDEDEDDENEQDEEDEDDDDDDDEDATRRAKSKKKSKKVKGKGKAKANGRSDIESYTGVAIRVSFNSKRNEGLKIQQLSGGQKAVVALAMIFAIQKCDPAPFYLFDEIDANLDAERRTAVAAMIDELAESGQYICTTFRPELIQHASSFFGVVFDARKISSVKSISADECYAFVEAAEQVREAADDDDQAGDMNLDDL